DPKVRNALCVCLVLCWCAQRRLGPQAVRLDGLRGVFDGDARDVAVHEDAAHLHSLTRDRDVGLGVEHREDAHGRHHEGERQLGAEHRGAGVEVPEVGEGLRAQFYRLEVTLVRLPRVLAEDSDVDGVEHEAGTAPARSCAKVVDVEGPLQAHLSLLKRRCSPGLCNRSTIASTIPYSGCNQVSYMI